MTLLERLAQHLQRPVNEATRQRARLHLLDWLACVAGARGSEVATSVRFSADRPMWKATFLGNVLEMDDVHRKALLHPGPVIWPVALNSPGWDTLTDVLRAAVVGYEATIAVGETFDAYHYAHYHPTATAGQFGAAACEAFSGNSDQPIIAQTMALAGSVTGGLWQTRHGANMGKQWHIVHVVQSASTAYDYAFSGVTGPLALLEGPQGLYAATCREPKPMVFTDHWRIEEVSFKPWAACRHAHPAIDCALELRAAGRLTAPFHVDTYADAITFCDNLDPKTETEAKFSLQHAVAVIADGRNATPHDFTLDAIAALAALRAQVTVSEAPEITARYPEHFGARVNGLELVDCRGDPERPMGAADIIAKMHMLAEYGGLPPEEANRAVELALRSNDAGAITKMLEEWLS